MADYDEIKEDIRCLICGQDFTGQPPENMIVHAGLLHFKEFSRSLLSSPKIQKRLLAIQPFLFKVGFEAAKRMRGIK